MRFNKTYLALAMTAILITTGCSSTEEEGLADSTQGTDASTSGLADGSMSGSQFGSGNGSSFGSGSGANLGPEFSDPNNPLSKQVIYFELDSSQVKQDYVPVVAAHARYLASHPNQHVILSGHADERGSSEYNIALGEQRSKSVERMMRSQGVSASQLEVVSYGEEKPVVSGHDESAWQQNRRVEVGYQ
ncbi:MULTISPECIES: peptidoglycan-associated lipoprotein Pal [Methylomonas]|uniref:Peptidoglycan-associated lipoprotein n=2 Tax=Methylomonas TaxID=416 RepID=A0A126T6A8_9GAMM|nr:MULTISPECIES: peptidoglycan-associated lipoprotein Pal [Methylomonas]AMK77623.1 peptidoglycan-associated lipoprotein [Methylomonas denitrificans]OAH96882.1 peptidoglycan-associated lipoprotein [Methylomonas methanica]TCV86792.1 peptidoglycan-associated lipoprotein [Methylomonas methanica]